MSTAAEAVPVSCEHVAVVYGRRRVLEDVSLRVPAGCVYALLGRNGSGKSSLVRCLLGQQRVGSGRAELFGRDAWRERAGLMARVGVVPEEPDAPPELSLVRLLALAARMHDVWDEEGARERLRRFGVPGETPFGRLSKGQKVATGARTRLVPEQVEK
jgi:ABC-2 type transport system ATP-binding protein